MVFSPGSFVPLNVTLGSDFPFSTEEVWVAVFGQLNQVDDKGNRTLVGNFYLDAGKAPASGPIPQATTDLPAADSMTPDQVILPSFTLAAWGSNLKLPVPGAGLEYSGRVVVSVGTPAQCQVVAADHSVAAPTGANPADPSTGTFYDFVEFTVAPGSSGTNNVDIDTTQVDSFGIPMSVQLNGNFTGGGPIGIAGHRSDIFADFRQFVASPAAAPFAVCASAAPLRLLAPKTILEANLNPKAGDPLVTYFDAAIDAFFVKYFSGAVDEMTQGGGQAFSIVSDADHKTYTGSVVKIQNGAAANVVLRLSLPGATTNYDIYYPFFSGNSFGSPKFGVQPKASFLSDRQAAEPPSRMVFACDAVFADDKLRTNEPSDFDPKVLADLENSISAAFNRGVALNDPSTWGQRQGWFPADGVFNYWVQFWHEPGRAVGDLAYAFPYDDKFGASTNLQKDSVASVSVGLESWGQLVASTVTLTVADQEALKQKGPITASASVSGAAGVPTGTVTFYVDGVELAAAPVAAGQAALPSGTTLPPLPDGGKPHTYTLTAVYAGDSQFQPGVVFQALALAGPGGRSRAGVAGGVVKRAAGTRRRG